MFVLGWFGFFPACINCSFEAGNWKHVIHEQIDIAWLLCILLPEKTAFLVLMHILHIPYDLKVSVHLKLLIC